jgi:hypothetical protein
MRDLLLSPPSNEAVSLDAVVVIVLRLYTAAPPLAVFIFFISNSKRRGAEIQRVFFIHCRGNFFSPSKDIFKVKLTGSIFPFLS